MKKAGKCKIRGQEKFRRKGMVARIKHTKKEEMGRKIKEERCKRGEGGK